MESLKFTPNMEGKFKRILEVKGGVEYVILSVSSKTLYKAKFGGNVTYYTGNSVLLNITFEGMRYDEYHKLLKEWEEIEMDGKKETKEERVKLTIEFDREFLEKMRLGIYASSVDTKFKEKVMQKYNQLLYKEVVIKDLQDEFESLVQQVSEKQQQIAELTKQLKA